jgi:hypothetical protein
MDVRHAEFLLTSFQRKKELLFFVVNDEWIVKTSFGLHLNSLRLLYKTNYFCQFIETWKIEFTLQDLKSRANQLVKLLAFQ